MPDDRCDKATLSFVPKGVAGLIDQCMVSAAQEPALDNVVSGPRGHILMPCDHKHGTQLRDSGNQIPFCGIVLSFAAQHRLLLPACHQPQLELLCLECAALAGHRHTRRV